MSLPEALLKVLNNNEEPLTKRLKIADNAFNASEFQLHHKEALLLKWIVNNSHEEIWSLAIKWLSSKEFKDLTQNDIHNEDIFAIVELFQKKLLQKNLSVFEKQQVINSVLLLCDNKVFQQYFKYNTELYCKLISLSLEGIELSSTFTDFITKPFLFPKNVLSEEHFSKHFLNILYPVFVKKTTEFAGNKEVFDETVRVIQKCMMQGNVKDFQNFFDHQFNTENEVKEYSALPKMVFKHLALTLHEEDSSIAPISFKLFFSAYCDSLKDSHWSLKCLIFLTELIQFDVSKDFNIKVPLKKKLFIKLSKSLDILLAILDVLCTNNVQECSVSNMTLSEFLRNILKTLITLQIQSSTVLEIIHKCILINPLVIEPLVNNLIVFVMVGNHNNFKETTENVVVAIFEVFSKLHRVEHFIAKMIPALKSALTTGNKLPKYEDTYSFRGEQDIIISQEYNLCLSDIFSENILECLTRCLNGLASWQVINVFKTMLYHLRNTVDEYSSNSFGNDLKGLVFLEILGTLTTCLLQSVRIADHTIPQNVVDKFLKGLEELKDILKNFGAAILKREHNHITMRTFLNISYTWAEIYLTLTYYSMNDEVRIPTVLDNTYSAANLKYLHSYMDIKEWQLIVQRITNFGEYPCKTLLQHMYIQKLRAMMLLEKSLNDDILSNIIKTLQTHLEDTWKDLVLDRFTVNFVLPKMDKSSLIFLAEKLIESNDLYEKNHIKDSCTLTKAIAYVVMSKINKLHRMKRKHDTQQAKNFSSKVFALCPEDIFFVPQDLDITEIIEQIKSLYEEGYSNTTTNVKSKEEKLRNYLVVLKKVPFIYCEIHIQKLILLYLFSLSTDVLDCAEEVKELLEDLIIGTLQAIKFPLTDIFDIEILGSRVLTDFQRSHIVFSLIVDNVFKHESSIMALEPLVSNLIKNLDDTKRLSSSILILQAVHKIKKSKIDPSTIEKANQYKEKILSKISKLVCKSDFFIEAYATCLKHYLSAENGSAILNKLLDKLGSYLDYTLANISEDNKRGCAVLFTTILQNKTKIKSFKNDTVINIWNACKKINIGDEYCHLVKLIVTLIPNDEFQKFVTDLFELTEKSINDQKNAQLVRKLKMWESILTCDVNATKMKIWQEILEELICKLLHILKNVDFDEPLFKSIVNLEQSIIQTQHFILSPPLLDLFIMTPSILMQHKDQHFESVFGLAIATLEMLLKHRNASIMDRLPAFLQQYRILLKCVTRKSNSDETSVPQLDPKAASDCVHNLEKLTKNLVACKKDMSRIAVFLIADILERYEQINLFPNVKLHLNNCIYSLMSLCDHHAVSYLMRGLSNASTEMFKIMYDHYKKYYMFTGKV